MSSTGIFDRSYPGYDVDELIFDLDDSDFGNELKSCSNNNKMKSFRNSSLELQIRHSKSDSFLMSGFRTSAGFLMDMTMEEGLTYARSRLAHYSKTQMVNGQLEDGPTYTRSFHNEQLNNNNSTNIITTDDMLTLEGLRKQYSSCFSCGVSWSDGHISLDCGECGGYSMQRPCPDCDGKCCNVWSRDLAKTHARHLATWEGSCVLLTSTTENNKENLDHHISQHHPL